MPRGKGIDWDAVRADYESGMSGNQLSARYDVTMQTVYYHKEQDARRGIIWARKADARPYYEIADDPEPEPTAVTEPEPQRARRRSNVLNFPRTGSRAVDDAINDAGLDIDMEQYLGATAEDALKGHPGLAVMMVAVSRKLMADFISGALKPGLNQSKADVAEKVGSFVAKTIQAGRDVAGVKPGTPSVGEANADSHRLEIIEQVIEPMKLPVDNDGRFIA